MSSVQKARDATEGVVAVCDVLAGLVPPDVDAFTADVRTQWAVEMGLIRIGEAVNRIPDEVLGLFSEQPWREIVAMRNLAPTSTKTLTHGEYGALSPAMFLACVPTSSAQSSQDSIDERRQLHPWAASAAR